MSAIMFCTAVCCDFVMVEVPELPAPSVGYDYSYIHPQSFMFAARIALPDGLVIPVRQLPK